jgi:membrane fusion protein, copper/silver efflux system
MKRIFLIAVLGLITALWSLALFTAEDVSTQEKSQGKASGTAQEATSVNEASSAVEIPPQKQQLIGVKKTEVSIQPIQRKLRTVGRVEYDERKLATVNIKVEGWIEKLYADYGGKYVKKGERLAEVYSPELYATQLEFVNLLQWKADKSHRFQRNVEFNWGDRYGTTGRILTFDLEALLQVARQKLMLWEISEEQIKKVEETRQAMKRLTLYSPIDGYIIQKQVVEGTRVQPGDKIFDIADLSTVWVIADIYAHELPMIKAGQPAKIGLSFFPGKEFSSKIDYIYPTLSGSTRTAKARFVIPNPDGKLKPQMFADVEIKIDLGKRLAIPEDAVIDTGTKKVVYVDKGEGYFEPREVVLGLRTDEMVEVIKGLKTGEKVASGASFLIDSEAKLKGIVQ